MDPFAQLIEELRRLQDCVVRMDASDSVLTQASERLAAVSGLLTPYMVHRDRWRAGRRFDIAGRGQALVPPVHVACRDGAAIEGFLTFRAFYHGSNGYVNASAVALGFVEAMALLAYSGERPPSRIAHLGIDYKAAVLIDTEIRVAARIDRLDGRKLFLAAEMRDAEAVVLAAAEALFVLPRA